jgi:hypothetical protein
MNTKRYLLFSFDGYYPSGGWDDFVKDFDSLDEAKDHFKTADDMCEFAHVIDLNKMTQVWCYYG